MRLRWHVVKNHYPKVNVDWKRVDTLAEAEFVATEELTAEAGPVEIEEVAVKQ